MRPSEIIFEVTEAIEGGYDAKALGYSIFTQGRDWADMKSMAKDAVLCHFDDGCAPEVIRLHLVKDKIENQFGISPRPTTVRFDSLIRRFVLKNAQCFFGTLPSLTCPVPSAIFFTRIGCSFFLRQLGEPGVSQSHYQKEKKWQLLLC